MKKALVVSVMIFLYAFLAACMDGTIDVTPTVNPTAQALMETIAIIEKTREGISASATAYSYTPTFTKAPTNTPDKETVIKIISDSINNQLISTFGADIRVEDVDFGPLGAQELTYLYIEIYCAGDNNAACPTSHVIIAVVDACKERKKKVLDNISKSTNMLTITIFDPVAQPRVVEVNWSDVLDYINNDLTGDEFIARIKYVQ
jgi:hypothetical protein